MAIIRNFKNKIESAFGKGIRYPVSKYERNLQTILKHQSDKMITIDETLEKGRATIRQISKTNIEATDLMFTLKKTKKRVTFNLE